MLLSSNDAVGAIDFSIVIATHDRSHRLLACLDSIEAAALAARPLKTELLIICNACPDDTPVVARDWARQAQILVRVLDEPQQGACRARNRGIRAARGNVIVMTDDDCRFAESFLSVAGAAFAQDAGPAMRGGQLLLGDPDDLPMTVRIHTVGSSYGPPIFPGGFLIGCNVAFSREVVDRIGLYDTRFGPGTKVGAAEDTDYLFRAWKAGIPVIFDPDMIIHHHHGRRDLEAVRKLSQVYNRSDGAFYAKHVLSSPHLLKNLYWDLRNGLRERFGGPPFDPHLNLSHLPRVWDILVGAAVFVWRHDLNEAQSLEVPCRSERGARSATL